MTKGRVLVTGASGFTGRYICRQLEVTGYEVFGLTIDGSINSPTVRLTQAEEVSQIVRRISPQFVIHLAAVAYVGHENPSNFYTTNVIGTLNLLRALEASHFKPDLVIIASSANIYGNLYQKVHIKETFLPHPINDYALSKWMMEGLVQLWKKRLPITIVRPFNYTGVGQSENFVVPKIVSAFKKHKNQIILGNLNISRDFSDVRDVARWYVELVEQRSVGEVVNFCSGRLISLKEIIQSCEKITNRSISIVSTSELKRKNDLVSLCGSPDKLKLILKDAGKPRYNLNQTLVWMLSEG